MYSVSASILPLTHFSVRTSYFASMLRNFWLCNCPEENGMVLDMSEPVAKYLAAKGAKDAGTLSWRFDHDDDIPFPSFKR